MRCWQPHLSDSTWWNITSGGFQPNYKLRIFISGKTLENKPNTLIKACIAQEQWCFIEELA